MTTDSGNLVLSFKSVASQSFDLFEPKLGHMEMKAQVDAAMPSVASMTALGAYYTANGAMMFGAAVTSAAAIAATLY